MNIKKSLGFILKRSSQAIISQNTACLFGAGVEDMPKVLKEVR